MSRSIGDVRVSVDRRFGWTGLAVVGLLLAVGLSTNHDLSAVPAAIGTAVAMLGSAALFLAPPRLLLLYAAVAAGGVSVSASGRAGDIGWFAVCVIAAWCVLAGRRWDGLIFWAAAMVLFGIQRFLPDHDPGWGAWIAGTTFTSVAVTLLRRQLDLVAQLRAAQVELAARSRAEERNRIARELHDVIAHSLTVSLLHVSSARLAVEHDPADAVRALLEAERLGRQSLSEVRAAVGLLRAGSVDRDGIAAPVPGIDDLAALVGQVRAAGIDVEMVIDGDVTGLPATAGSTVYRIVQEALTNVAKHAPSAHATVRATMRPSGSRRRIDVLVDSDGPAGHGSGMGVASMSDRAGAVGGTCDAGPGGSGWLVHASIPCDADAR